MAFDIRISYWSSDVSSSDLDGNLDSLAPGFGEALQRGQRDAARRKRQRDPFRQQHDAKLPVGRKESRGKGRGRGAIARGRDPEFPSMIAAHQIGCQRADADDADDPARAMREPRPEARDLEVEFHRPDEEGGLPLSDPVNAERDRKSTRLNSSH